jgi:hypothetical protein
MTMAANKNGGHVLNRVRRPGEANVVHVRLGKVAKSEVIDYGETLAMDVSNLGILANASTLPLRERAVGEPESAQSRES